MTIASQEQFIYHDPIHNNNKIWRYEIHDDGVIHVFWGRVGAGEQHITGISRPVLEKRMAEKLAKGYQRVSLHVPTANASIAQGISPTSKEGQFTQWVFKAANVSIGNFLYGAVNALSVDQLNKARKILKGWSNTSSTARKQDIVSDYYRTIPTKLPSKIVLSDLVAEFDPAEQENRLDQLEANLASYTPQGVQTQANLFNTQLKLAEGEVLHSILGLYEKAQTNKRRIPKPDYILQVRIPGERENYEACAAPNPQILFHGTNAAYLLHILRSGLRRPTHAANGWRLGPGIYFAEDPVRSYQYTQSYQSQKAMLICEVRIGKSIHEPGSKSFTTPPTGYHSVRGTQSWSGIDEIVVYDASQVTIRGILVYA